MSTRDTTRSPLANAQPSLRSSSLGALFMGVAALSTGCDASGIGTSGDAANPATARQALTGRPVSCQELKNTNPSAVDGQYVLYVNGDVARPWTVYCHGMAGTPAEYLSLPSMGTSVNYSQYTAGYNNGGGTDVRTVYSKVRVDPTTLRVNTADQTFSFSSGLLWHGGAVTSMAYAAAMNCDFGNPGLGNIDLRGTSFTVAPNQFVAVGYYGSGAAHYSSNNQVVDLWNRGECGWMSVQGADHPFNGRGAQLQLQYTRNTPASCQQVKNANPSAGDGEYVLYVNGDAAQPWTAWCHNMAGTPAEYLSLVATGCASVNFSQYTAGYNNGGGSNVRTVYSKIRVDPTTLRVNTADQTFSSSSGLLWHPANTPVTSMAYAAAMNCDFGNPGLSNIDLRGTSFTVAPNQFVVIGYYGSGEAHYSSNNQVVDVWNRGECGWMSMQGADHPFNGRGAQLQLQLTQQP
jgi:hypothetical protein